MNHKFIAILLILFSPSIFASNLAEVLYTQGKVEVYRNNYVLEAKKGMALLLDDVIVTKSKSMAIISYLGNSKIKLDPKSSLLIEEMKSEESIKKSGGIALSIYLKVGSLVMDFVNPKKNKEIEVRTDQVALGVRGTQFFIGYEEGGNKDVYMAVHEGVVDVLNYQTDDSDAVEAGNGMWIAKGRELSRPTKFDWVKRLNWNFKDFKNGTGFRNKNLSNLRKSEVRKKLRLLFQRKRKPFKHQMRYRLRSQKIEERQSQSARRFSKKAKKKSLTEKRKKERQKMKDEMRRKLNKRRAQRRQLLNRNPIPSALPTLPPVEPPTSTKPPGGGDSQGSYRD